MAQSTREVNTLANLYGEQGGTYTKIVAGFTIPVVKRFTEGHTLSASEAVAFSNYILERAASVANSNLDRGSWKDLSDADKVTKATSYLNTEYAFSADIGGEVFGMSLLEQAADTIIATDNADKFAALTEAEGRKAREPLVAKMLNTPELTEKYNERIGATMAAIMAKRHAKRVKTEGGKLGAVAAEIEL